MEDRLWESVAASPLLHRPFANGGWVRRQPSSGARLDSRWRLSLDAAPVF